MSEHINKTYKKLLEIRKKTDLKLAEREKILFEKNLLKPTWEYSVKN